MPIASCRSPATNVCEDDLHRLSDQRIVGDLYVQRPERKNSARRRRMRCAAAATKRSGCAGRGILSEHDI